MIEYLVIIATGIACLVTLYRWQLGVWLVVLTGYLQDPIRKLVPGEPVYLVMLCAAVFAALLLGLLFRRYRFDVTRVPGWRPTVSTALLILILLVSLQLVLAYANSGSLIVVMLGALTYYMPILAILAGFYYAIRVGENGIVWFMVFYCTLCILFTAGIYLEYLGLQWQALGEVGPGLTIFDVGTQLEAYSGFFRSSEIAAWHVVLGSSFFMILATRSRYISIRLLCMFGIVFLIAAGLLTGRRKLIVSVVIFVTCYWCLITVYYRQSLRVALAVVLLGLIAFWLTAREYYGPDQTAPGYDLYIERASGVFGDISERGKTLGVGAVVSAVRKHGLVGMGAGTAGQGARFSGKALGYHYEAEGGLGRLVVELGLLGLLVVAGVLVAFTFYLFRVVRYLSYRGGSYGFVCFGMIGILLANLAHFTVASQVFSDPLVLILLGLFAGFITSGPVIVRPATRPAAVQA